MRRKASYGGRLGFDSFVHYPTRPGLTQQTFRGERDVSHVAMMGPSIISEQKAAILH